MPAFHKEIDRQVSSALQALSSSRSLTERTDAAVRFRAEPSIARTTWTAAHRYFEESSLRLEAILTQALLHMASGETHQRVLAYLSAQLGEEVVAPLRTAIAQDQDTLMRGIVALLPTS